MENYEYFNIPRSCEINNTIFKKLFYENVDLPPADKKLFTDEITKIIWLYCLKPETINIQPYKDEGREYSEIEFIEVEMEEEKKINRIAEIIMRTIPYPLVLIFRLNDKVKFYVAHQRCSLSDSSKNTIEEFISTEWIDKGNPLLDKFDIRKMRFTNFYALYSDIVDLISIHNAATLLPIDTEITGEDARKLTAEVEELGKEINLLKSKLKKETQFNKKMDLNINIKQLEKRKLKLLGRQ